MSFVLFANMHPTSSTRCRFGGGVGGKIRLPSRKLPTVPWSHRQQRHKTFKIPVPIDWTNAPYRTDLDVWSKTTKPNGTGHSHTHTHWRTLLGGFRSFALAASQDCHLLFACHKKKSDPYVQGKKIEKKATKTNARCLTRCVRSPRSGTSRDHTVLWPVEFGKYKIIRNFSIQLCIFPGGWLAGWLARAADGKMWTCPACAKLGLPTLHCCRPYVVNVLLFCFQSFVGVLA